VPAEFGEPLLPMAWLIDHLRGDTANLCANACLARVRLVTRLAVLPRPELHEGPDDLRRTACGGTNLQQARAAKMQVNTG
jgi:hypothetical protein